MGKFSLVKAERQCLTECFPGKLEQMTRKPEDFLKYAKGRRCPRSHEIEGSPLNWPLTRYPRIADTYNSLLFASIRASNDVEALDHLSYELYHSKACQRSLPIADGHGPLLTDVAQGQVEQLVQRLIAGCSFPRGCSSAEKEDGASDIDPS